MLLTNVWIRRLVVDEALIEPELGQQAKDGPQHGRRRSPLVTLGRPGDRGDGCEASGEGTCGGQQQRYHATPVPQFMDVRFVSGGDRDGDDQGGDLLPAFGQEPVQRIGDRAEKEVVHGGSVFVGEIEDRGSGRIGRSETGGAVRLAGSVSRGWHGFVARPKLDEGGSEPGGGGW